MFLLIGGAWIQNPSRQPQEGVVKAGLGPVRDFYRSRVSRGFVGSPVRNVCRVLRATLVVRIESWGSHREKRVLGQVLEALEARC